jgi:hypothetical protein
MVEGIPGSDAGAVTRRRQRIQLTVHPRTDVMLLELCERFATNKGRIVDKLVQTVYQAYKSGRQHCISGKPCKVDLTDLPEVF